MPPLMGSGMEFSRSAFLRAGRGPPLLGCLQFTSGGSAPGNILAGPPASPPHDHARHGKYHWEDSRQEHYELPDRAAVAALVDPSDPLRRTVSGERPWQAFHVAAAIVHHDGGSLAAHRIPQLHAPSRAGGIPAFASAFALGARRASASVRTRHRQEYDGWARIG